MSKLAPELIKKQTQPEEHAHLIRELLIHFKKNKITQEVIVAKLKIPSLQKYELSKFLNSFTSDNRYFNSLKNELIITKCLECYPEEIEAIKAIKLNKVYAYYIYYYLSYEGYKVKAALMKIVIKGQEWTQDEGEVIYYSKNSISGIIEEKVYTLSRMREFMKDGNQPQVAFFKAVDKENDRVNFFSINVKGLKIEDRQIMFLTYSVVESQNDELSCGYGLLEKKSTENDARENICKTIENAAPDWVIMALQNKKLSFNNFEHQVYKSENELLQHHSQYRSAIKSEGFYVGYFLSKDELEIPDRIARVVKTVMEIKANGEVSLFYKSLANPLEKETDPRYKGTIYFPNQQYGFMKISLAYHERLDDYRYEMVLNSNKSRIAGILTGYTSRFRIFSSPIYFDKIIISNPTTTIAEIIKSENPRRIQFSELEHDMDLKESLNANFKSLIEGYFNKIADCIPGI